MCSKQRNEIGSIGELNGLFHRPQHGVRPHAPRQRLASPVGSRQATGPRRRARTGRVAGDGQPALLGLRGGDCSAGADGGGVRVSRCLTCDKMMVWTSAGNSWDAAIQYRKGAGTETTHWRVGTQGMTRSTRWAAVWAMRRPAHDGQNPRRLQLKVRSTSCLQVSQPSRSRYSSGRGDVSTHPTSTLTIAQPAQPWEASGLVAIVPHGVHSWSCMR